jgi:hypothetical protein
MSNVNLVLYAVIPALLIPANGVHEASDLLEFQAEVNLYWG